MKLFQIDVFIKELQPHFDKFVSYLDEVVSSADMSLAPLMHTTTLGFSNVDLASKEHLLLANNTHVNFVKTHKRHQPWLGDVCRLVGTSHRLYELCVSTLTQQFVSTHNWFYATLRIHLLGKLCEMHNHETVQGIAVATAASTSASESTSEMVFKFCTVIASCLKERTLGTKRAKELEHIMESKKFEKIIP
jgi:hypothetical protein